MKIEDRHAMFAFKWTMCFCFTTWWVISRIVCVYEILLDIFDDSVFFEYLNWDWSCLWMHWQIDTTKFQGSFKTPKTMLKTAWSYTKSILSQNNENSSNLLQANYRIIRTAAVARYSMNLYFMKLLKLHWKRKYSWKK